MSRTTTDDRHLLALISLLSTEQESSLSVLQEQIQSFSDATLHRMVHLSSVCPEALDVIRLIMAERAAPLMQARLLEWSREDKALESGMILTAQCGYPWVTSETLSFQLESLARSVREAVQGAPVHTQTETFLNAMHEGQGFRASNRYHPDEAYLNRVLDRRSGSSLTLSTVYCLVARRLGMTADVVLLPNQSLCCFRRGTETVFAQPGRDSGTLQASVLRRWALESEYLLRPEYLQPASPMRIVKYIFGILERVYVQVQDPVSAERARRFVSVLH